MSFSRLRNQENQGLPFPGLLGLDLGACCSKGIFVVRELVDRLGFRVPLEWVAYVVSRHCDILPSLGRNEPVVDLGMCVEE